MVVKIRKPKRQNNDLMKLHESYKKFKRLKKREQ